MSSAPSPLSATTAAAVFRNNRSAVLQKVVDRIGKPLEMMEFLGPTLASTTFTLKTLNEAGDPGAQALRGMVATPGIADLLTNQGFGEVVVKVRQDIATREKSAMRHAGCDENDPNITQFFLSSDPAF